MLVKHKSIEKVSLNSGIDDEGIKIIQSHASKLGRVIALNLSENYKITDISIPIMVDILENTKLELSLLTHNSIKDRGSAIPSLMKFRILNMVEYANFTKAGVNDDDICKICEHFKTYGYGNMQVFE